MASVGLLLLAAWASPVLAAPSPAGEPAAPDAATHSSVVTADRLASLGVWAVVSAVTLIVLARRGALSPARLRSAPGRRVETTPPMVWLIAGVGMMLLWRVGGGVGVAVAHAVGLDPTSLAGQASAIWAGHAAVLLALGAILASRSARSAARDAGLTARPADAALGLGAMLLAVGPVLLTLNLSALVADLARGEPSAPIAHSFLAAMVDSPFSPAWWAGAVAVVLVTPVVEEVIYRGLIQSGLRRATGSPVWAAVIAAGLFTLVHLGAADPEALPGLFVLGLAFGLALERTGRLGAPVVMHALFNAGMLAAAML